MDSISRQNKENLFYSEDVMLNQASVFKRKTIYFLEKFTDEAGENSELILLVNDLCNVKDIKVEEDFYADYIVYYFHSYPYEMFNYQIKKRKFNLKIIQSEVFSSGLLER
ncbi:hypothetical protein [Myroides sp. WP-1]|uniref:hypothetical protein n=1 Tax=Myroides sp. WP-1 TaxID=2759944 RepID=UPI0015FC027E|nr:hypothetical protein [Myroides sp. WP-1]MBB1139284.1 hypothetical protein [Myroides sp. WP-1]